MDIFAELADNGLSGCGEVVALKLLKLGYFGVLSMGASTLVSGT